MRRKLLILKCFIIVMNKPNHTRTPYNHTFLSDKLLLIEIYRPHHDKNSPDILPLYNQANRYDNMVYYMVYDLGRVVFIWIVYSVCYLAQRDNMTTEDFLINILFKNEIF